MPIKELTEEEARQLTRSGLGQELSSVAAECCAPVFWFTPPPKEVSQIRNFGTVSLVQTGSRSIGITADHVIDAYLEARSTDPDLVAQIGDTTISLHERIISRSASLDLCTLSLSVAEAKQIGRRFHESPYAWPPKPPEVDRGVFAAGYLSISKGADGRVEFGGALISSVAAVVEPDRIMMALDRAYLVPVPGLRVPEEDEHWGGLSGGPLFSVVHTESLVTWRLSGILIQYLPISGAQVFRAVPVTFVDSVGLIDADRSA